MTLKPPFFDNAHGVSLQVVEKLLDALPVLDDRNRRIISQLALSGGARDDFQSIQAIGDQLGLKLPAVRNRLKVLVSAGVVEHSSTRYEGCRRPVSVFRLTYPDLSRLGAAQLALSPPCSGLPTLPEAQEIHSMSSDLMTAMLREEAPFFVDNLFCTVLFCALPVSRKLTFEPTDVTIDWYGKDVPVTLRPLAERAVCKAEDLRFYIGLITYLAELVQSQGVPQTVIEGGVWTVKVSDILNVMGMSTAGGNTKTALASFERLASTRVEFSSLPEAVMERYGFEKAEQTFIALANYGVYQKRVKVNRSTYITFTLPPTIHGSLIKYGRDFFSLSPNALRYNEPYFLRVHLWAKRRLGQNLNSKTIDHKRAWKEISPGISFQEHRKRLNELLLNFEAFVGSLLDEQIIEKIQYSVLIPNPPLRLPEQSARKSSVINATVNVFGYILRITDTHIHITRDIADPYVGIGRSGPVLLSRSADAQMS
ncbi:MAG: hypothetical protein AAF098_06735 [Pseudomonadota bacterium]